MRSITPLSSDAAFSGDPSLEWRLAVIEARPDRRRRLERSAVRGTLLEPHASFASVDEMIAAAPGLPGLTVAVLGLGESGGESPVMQIRHLATSLPDVRIVVVGAQSDSSVRRALRAGASGYVREIDAERVLAITVEAVCTGQTSVPLDLAYHVGETALSYRERQVLGMVVLGSSNSEIARRLFLSESTVKSHLSTAYRKLGVRSRKEAAALVLDKEGGLGMGILRITDTTALHGGGA